MPEDWRARILHARRNAEGRRSAVNLRTEMAQTFRRLAQTIIEPAFREVVQFAREQGVECAIESDLGGIQPHVMFYIRPSGRSIRYELDLSGDSVREVEGVYRRPMGQRLVWYEPADLTRQLTPGYARSSAAAIVQDHFRSLERAI